MAITNYYSYEGFAVIDNVCFTVRVVFVDGIEMRHLDSESLLVTTPAGWIVRNKRICKKIRLLIRHGRANMTLKSGLRWNDDDTYSDITNDNN